MFKTIWNKITSVFKTKTPAPAMTDEFDVHPINLDALRPPVPRDIPPLPKTIGDLVKQETRDVDCTKKPKAPTPPKPPKKPRKPRAKKVPASPDIVKIYADPKEEPTEKLDTRLDGYATKPKKIKTKE